MDNAPPSIAVATPSLLPRLHYMLQEHRMYGNGHAIRAGMEPIQPAHRVSLDYSQILRREIP